MRVYQFRHFGSRFRGPKTEARTLQRHRRAVNATMAPRPRPSIRRQPVSKRKPRRPSRDRDPYQAREAKKYANPIPSREFILGVMEEHGAPLRFDDLAEALALQQPDQEIGRAHV